MQFSLQSPGTAQKNGFQGTYTLLIANVFAHIRDQGHLHPRLEVRRLGLEPGPPRWEAITLAKSYSNGVLILNQNIYV
jgi:hypothetical protein